MLDSSWIIFMAFFIVFLIWRARKKPPVKEELYLNLSDSPDDDAAPAVLPVRANIFITYKSSEGAISKRQIKVTSSDGSKYIYAHCLLRNEARTFRIDRIQNCTDVDTGEVINNIPLYFRSKYHEACT